MGAMAAASMLLQYYVTESMYHQLHCISDVSMKQSHPQSCFIKLCILLVTPLLIIPGLHHQW